MKRLRRLLVRLCAAGSPPPVLAFDKWVSRQKLHEALATAAALEHVPPPEPLPAARSAAARRRRRRRCARQGARSRRAADAAAAQHAAAELAAASARAAAQLAAAAAEAEPAVQLEVSGATVRLRAAGVDRYVELRASHLQKLRDLHSGGDDAAFHRSVLAAAVRRIGRARPQCALSDGVFRVLRQRLAWASECFAVAARLPLARAARPLPTPTPFSARSARFFDLSRREDRACNPPFVPEVMLAAVAHAEALVAAIRRGGRAAPASSSSPSGRAPLPPPAARVACGGELRGAVDRRRGPRVRRRRAASSRAPPTCCASRRSRRRWRCD